MDVGSLLMKIGIKVDGKELEGLQASVAKTSAGFERLSAINSKLNLIVGTAAIRTVKDFVGTMGAESLELINVAAATNVSSEAFQKLKFAVGQAGSNVSELAPALGHLNRLIQDARLGGDDAIQTFYRLGISQQQISGFRGAQDALYAVMDALNKIHDPIKRQVMLEKALGGVGLARFALAGSQAAKASEMLAKRMGAVVSPQATSQYAQARIALSQFGVVIGGVAANLFREFAPSITSIVHGMEDFYSANKKVIESQIHEWVSRLIGVMAVLYYSIYVVARAVANFVSTHPKFIAFLEKWGLTALGIAGGMYAVKTAFTSLLGVKNAILGFFGVLSASTTVLIAEFALWAVGISTVFLALYSGWQMLHGKSFGDTAIVKSLQAIAQQAMSAKASLGSIFDEFMPGMRASVGVSGYAPGQMQYGPPSQAQTWKDLLVPNATSFVPPSAMMMGITPGFIGAGAGLTANTTNNVNVNVSNGMTADDAQIMVTNSLRDSQTKAMEAALDRLRKPHRA